MSPKPLLFRKVQRVVRSQDFGRILREGQCVADGVLVLCAVKASQGHNLRIGITIPKKTGCAVVRNRWKRLIREAFRSQQHELPRGYDLIVRPKKGAIANPDEIRKSIPRLAARAAKRLR